MKINSLVHLEVWSFALASIIYKKKTSILLWIFIDAINFLMADKSSKHYYCWKMEYHCTVWSIGINGGKISALKLNSSCGKMMCFEHLFNIVEIITTFDS